MSSYYKDTKHPKTGKWQIAMWLDDYFGDHHYGVEFPDGKVYDPRETTLETREPEAGPIMKQPRLIRKTK